MSTIRLSVRLSLHPRHNAELERLARLLRARTGGAAAEARRLIELAAIQRGLASLRLELERGGSHDRAA